MNGESQKELVDFAIALWKNRWVCVPYFHLPEDSPSDQKLDKIRTFLPEDYEPALGIEEEDQIYKNIHPIEMIVPWLWDEKDLEELCTTNDIPIGWVIGRQLKQPSIQNGTPNRRLERKIPSLRGKVIQKILTQAKKLNKQHATVLKILWHVNKSLSNSGASITLEEILRMQIKDVSPYYEHGCNWIRLYRKTSLGGHLVIFSVPGYLWKAIRGQIGTKTLFLFANKHGGPISPSQVNGTLKHAANLAGIKGPITSLSLRPTFKKSRIERIAKRDRYDGPTTDHLKNVTAEEWTALCDLIPELHPSTGRKPQHTPLEMLNAILHQLRTHCPIRKLPTSFPNWRAVDSQKRRWEKSGVLQKILANRSA